VIGESILNFLFKLH